VITKPMTYGNFIDAMKQVSVGNMYAETFIEEWERLVPSEQLQQYRAEPLIEDGVINFVEDAAGWFQKVIEGTWGEKLYAERVASGHAFLKAIHAKCQKIGIEVELEKIDVPLTPSDLMSVAGLVHITPKGNVELTEMGQQLANESQAQ